MISIISTGDQQLQKIAAESSSRNKNVFGNFYEVFDEAMPKLKTNEDLFIIANTSFRDAKGFSVIGDSKKELFLNGVDAWDSFKDIFPANYTGNIYVNACNTPENDANVFNFVEYFCEQIESEFNKTQVFGRNGTVNGAIALPTERGWETSWMENDASMHSSPVNGRAKMGSHRSTRFASLSKSIPNPQNVQANKFYAFNETGNIMMVSTDLDETNMKTSVRDVFNEVSVFWGAMSKAICVTKDPATQMPYSIYDYDAIERVISGCGHFVHRTQEEVLIRTESSGEQWSKEIVGTLLGVPTGFGELGFAHAMMCSMGKAAWNISKNHPGKDVRVGNVVFVCEYLMGTPCVSAVVVHAELSENASSFRAGPCTNPASVACNWKLYKDTYMFVTPNFLNDFSGDLRSSVSNTEYNDLVGQISHLVTRPVHIDEITTSGKNSVPVARKLRSDTEYLMCGDNFGERQGRIRIGNHDVTINGWSNNTIKFMAPSEPVSSAVAIDLFMPGNINDPIATTSETFSVGSVSSPVFTN